MTKPTFKAFLSHRYKSPDANQRFFDVLSAHGNLHFEVDVGIKATNVTRLELFVRDADAFVGIYPFPSEDDVRPDSETALKASRYFRLELDLVLRSRRPAIVFVDARYGTAITVPKTTRVFRYNHREVLGVTSDRWDAQLSQLGQEFCDDVAAAMRLKAGRGESPARDRVGIILSSSKRGTSGYSKQEIAKIEERLSQLSLQAVHLNWKAAVDGRFMSELEGLDWAIVDIGAEACASGLPAFLHGHFIPQMRLIRVDAKHPRSPIETTILAAFDVGYPKDIIRWRDAETLDREFVQRLTTLYEPRKYIRTSDEARAYFAGAALRKETVFLSYSGDDRELVSGLAKALRNRFQQVFDYRDQGESIVPGRRWIEEVFDKLSTSAIGIPILSSTYFTSGNCMHEARQMMGLADAGKIRLFPVKIKEGPLELPNWIQDVQYVRGWEYPTPEDLVEKITSAYTRVEPANPADRASR
ncbi:MAG: toll/interleukin-1 receptor domain-containing protein [Thermoanaerobaculia bacterium]